MHNIRCHHPSRPVNLPWLACFFLALLLLVAAALARAAETPARSYETGFASLVKTTAELQQALPPAKRQLVRTELVFATNLAVPWIGLAPAAGETSPGAIHISSGLIDWMNRVAHAKALEEFDPDPLPRCFSAGAQDSAGKFLAVGSKLAPEQAWNFDVMNHQASLFNQMAGALLAIELAHQHLGHYRKHPPQPARDGNPAGICSVLGEREWREAVLKGARHALDCGLGVEGLRTLLDGFDKSTDRPAWSIHFVHPKANLARMSRDLEKMEKDFFLVEK